jgi:hypothetical protein
MAPGNTVQADLEVVMKRLQKLREYRSRLNAECNTVVDKYIAEGCPPEKNALLGDYIRRVQLRIRLINEVVDKQISSDPRVLRSA